MPSNVAICEKNQLVYYSASYDMICLQISEMCFFQSVLFSQTIQKQIYKPPFEPCHPEDSIMPGIVNISRTLGFVSEVALSSICRRERSLEQHGAAF